MDIHVDGTVESWSSCTIVLVATDKNLSNDIRGCTYVIIKINTTRPHAKASNNCLRNRMFYYHGLTGIYVHRLNFVVRFPFHNHSQKLFSEKFSYVIIDYPCNGLTMKFIQQSARRGHCMKMKSLTIYVLYGITQSLLIILVTSYTISTV